MKFNSLRHALNYQATCPVCCSAMLIDDRYAETRVEWRNGKQTTRLLWKTEDSEEIILDPDSSYVEFVEKYAAPEYVVGTSYSGQTPIRQYPKPKRLYDGHLYERIGMTCDNCCKYHYLIKFIIDVGVKQIIDIELNGETLSIEDNEGTVHEIKNIYGFEQTQYSYFPKDGDYKQGRRMDEKSITLPLIPLDLENPRKTLERIRTLIIFS